MTATRPSGAPDGPEGAGAAPETGPGGATPPQDRTALRERLAEAAAQWAYSYPISSNALGRTDDGAWKLARIWGEQITRIAVMPVMEAWAAEHERRVREQVAAEQRAAAQAIEDSRGENLDPLATTIASGCRVHDTAPAVFDDARTIAIVAYRHLADRIAGPEGT